MRNIALLAFISVFMLFFFGCVSNPPAPSVGEPLPPAGNDTLTPPIIQPAVLCGTGNILQKDACFLVLAKEKGDPEYCRSIYSVSTLDSCYDQFSDRLEVCKKITGAQMRSACLSKIAVKEKSDQICAMIDNADARLSCLQNVLPPCMLISDEDERALCLAIDKDDYVYCKSDGCFLAYAINKSKSDACLLISPPANKQACLAVVGNSVGICKQAPLVPVQDYCVELASAMLDNQGGCVYASEKSDYRNRCYTHFAVEKADMGVCGLADPEGARDSCYRNYSIELADTSACAKVKETLNNQNCYYTAATVNRKPSLCNPLPSLSMRDDCYAKPIFSKLGPIASDCGNVASETWKDKCYLVAAKMASDASLCGKISPGSDFDECVNLLGSGA